MLAKLFDQVAALNGDWPLHLNIIKNVEELGEVAGAYLKLNGRKPRKGVQVEQLEENLSCEIGDLLVTVLATAHSRGLTAEQLADYTQKGIDNWQRATSTDQYAAKASAAAMLFSEEEQFVLGRISGQAGWIGIWGTNQTCVQACAHFLQSFLRDDIHQRTFLRLWRERYPDDKADLHLELTKDHIRLTMRIVFMAVPNDD